MRKILSVIFSLFICVPLHAASLIHDTETEKLLTELIQPLATAANIPDSRLKIHIVDDDDF
ncbi:MAG: hypothetical protein J6R99_04805, partial [Alphaproteobacteria bacterium]|nr:hypothetical protein [Alphaproteobacteria bacterium]